MKRYEMRAEDLRQYLDEARAEIERLQAALREIGSLHITAYAQRHVTEIIEAALSGKGKT
jgi:predicted translin family RNA/ssDNA-binding protein